MDRRVLLQTFGCKLNQADSAMLAALFARRGWRVEGDGSSREPDLIVVNSCAVTARSEAKVRQAVRRMAREHPQVPIALVGCAAELRPRAFRELPNVRWVLGVKAKFQLPDLLDAPTVDPVPRGEVDPAPSVGLFWSRTRAFVKIQDGCRFGCSYCVVPLVRGVSRSVDPDKVVEQACELAERGHREIVVTGVDIGSYGLDLRPRRSLAWLLGRLAEQLPNVRIRLSSVEPTEVTDELIEVAASLPQVCRHWHIPIQSGSDRVLRKMRRPYDSQFVRGRLAALCQRLDTMGLGTDVIVGFPGESDADFRLTAELLEEFPFTYVHVFPFSRRPGTAMYGVADEVPKSVKEGRSQELRKLVAAKRRAFLERLVGTLQQVLVEKKARRDLLSGLTDTYVRVEFAGAESEVGEIVPVWIESVRDGALCGRRGSQSEKVAGAGQMHAELLAG